MEYTGERIVLEAAECAPDTLIFREHAERYKFASKYVKDKNVLDLACGVGYGSEILVQMGGPASVLGGDISAEAIEYAKKKYARLTNVRFELMNAENLTLADESVDVAVSFETIEHLPHVEEYLKNILRVLRPNGIYVVSTPNLEVTQRETGPVENPFHFHEFTYDEISALLGKYFSVKEVYYQRAYNPTAVTAAVKNISRWKWLYKKIIPKFIRVDLRNRFWPDISTDIGIHPYDPSVHPLNFVFVCEKRHGL